MIISGMKTQTPSYRSIRLWLWLAVILLCLVGGGIRLWQNQQRRAARKVSEQNNKITQASERATQRRIKGLWNSRTSPNDKRRVLSKNELENLLNDSQPFELIQEGDREIAHWADPATGRIYELRFRNNEWIGYGSSGSKSYVRPPSPTSTPPPFDQFTEKIQRQFAGSFSLGWGTGAWLVVLVLCISWKQQRRALAEIMLALTLMCGTAWLTWPYYSLTIEGIFSNDMLFWAVIMLVVSVGAILLSRRGVSPPPWPVCSHCGYNLTGNVSGVCPECGERI